MTKMVLVLMGPIQPIGVEMNEDDNGPNVIKHTNVCEEHNKYEKSRENERNGGGSFHTK